MSFLLAPVVSGADLDLDGTWDLSVKVAGGRKQRSYRVPYGVSTKSCKFDTNRVENHKTIAHFGQTCAEFVSERAILLQAGEFGLVLRDHSVQTELLPHPLACGSSESLPELRIGEHLHQGTPQCVGIP